MRCRTSAEHPLRIKWIDLPPGRIGLTICPGKSGDSIFGAPWCRDLETDIGAIREAGVSLVVSLIEDKEMNLLGVPTLGPSIEAAGIEWIHFPFPDGGVPSVEQGDALTALIARIENAVGSGKSVMVHCRGGLGRAGSIAARVLIGRGATAAEAMAAVRAVRPGAIETKAQEEWLEEVAG